MRLKSEPPVYIIVLTWNCIQDTIECLNSIRQICYSNKHIVVVDNGSVDDTPAIIKSHYPDVHIIENETNLGFSLGNNIGITWALNQGAEYVFILNNDTVVDSKAICEMLKYSSDTSPMVLVPKIYFYYSPTKIWCAGAKKTLFPPRIKMIGLNQNDSPRLNRPRQVDCATGCALLVHRQVFKDVGMFDPLYSPAYQEDYDFCLRIRKYGYKIMYVPTAHVWHKISQSDIQSGTKWYNLGKGSARLYMKHYIFPFLSLSTFAVWIITRELIYGQIQHILPFIRGLLSGWSESHKHGKRITK